MRSRVGKYPIAETLTLFPTIDKEALREKYGSQWAKGIAREVIYIDGFKVKVHSQRYQLFKKKGIVCVKCGMVGKFFVLEATEEGIQMAAKRGVEPSYHFNLYGLADDGSEVLMTKDHILPVSRGGTNRIENLQVMCTKCNGAKKARLESFFEHKSCCETMKSYGRRLGDTLKKYDELSPFKYCPWCKQELKYIKKG
jgi:hypothetical protein